MAGRPNRQTTRFRARVSALVVASSLMATAVLAPGGCSTSVREQGDTGIAARYQAVTLTADIPHPSGPEAVIDAAEATLKQIGWSVDERVVRPGSAVINGRPANAGKLDTVTITARAEGGPTQLKITIGPWGDEVMSRAILEDVLMRLGM